MSSEDILFIAYLSYLNLVRLSAFAFHVLSLCVCACMHAYVASLASFVLCYNNLYPASAVLGTCMS